MTMHSRFDYAKMTTRNVGFVTPEEQELLRQSRIFVCGVGGMGGACLQALARAGVQHFTIADMDTFEVSNLNRQVFASMSDVGHSKVETTKSKLLDINPEITIKTYGADWVEHLDEILPQNTLVINGMDDIPAGIHLYRKAKEHRVTVIDAYSAPLPSVTVVKPDDPRPEERLGFHTKGLDWKRLNQEMIDHCKSRELLFVFANSSSANHFHLKYAVEVFQGKRSRPSFAPMVITTGNMMAFEAVRWCMQRKAGTDYRGYFFNPWTANVERPRNAWLGKLITWYAQRQLDKLLSGGRE